MQIKDISLSTDSNLPWMCFIQLLKFLHFATRLFIRLCHCLASQEITEMHNHNNGHGVSRATSTWLSRWEHGIDGEQYRHVFGLRSKLVVLLCSWERYFTAFSSV